MKTLFGSPLGSPTRNNAENHGTTLLRQPARSATEGLDHFPGLGASIGRPKGSDRA